MIRRANRFQGHNSVSRVRGSVENNPLFSLRFASNHSRDFRLAIVVSKKIAAHAVDRNKIRRRLFETVRTQRRVQGLPIDLIFYVKDAKIATMNIQNLHEEVARATKKALAKL